MSFCKSSRFLFALKAIVFLLMTSLIVHQLFYKNDFKAMWGAFRENFSGENVFLPVLAVLLMPFNWLLETAKWKVLLKKSSTSFSCLAKGIFAGLTIGLVTPGRSGEFLGRMFFIEDGEKTKSFYLSTIGGLAQSAVTLVAGAVFASLMVKGAFLQGLITGGAVVFLLLFFRFDWLNVFINRIPFLEKNQWVISNEELPPLNLQMLVFGISALRYSAYLTQYVLLLWFFGVHENYFSLFAHSSIYLAAQSVSPFMPLWDLSFRSGTALLIFDNISSNSFAVLCAVAAIWFLNLLLPALIGYVFIFRKENLDTNALVNLDSATT